MWRRAETYKVPRMISVNKIAAHRGRIWAESGPAGNVFLIRLPVCPKPSGPEAGGPGDGAGRLPGE